MRVNPAEFKDATAHQMIFQRPTQYKSIKNFREMINDKEFEDKEAAEAYRRAPLMLLDPTRKVEDEK